MQLLLACYDPALPASTGDYWVYRHADLDLTRLNDLRQGLLNLPQRSRDLLQGVAAIDSQWVYFFREYDGGRDGLGRPGRRVLFLAAAPRKLAVAVSPLNILNSQSFIDFESELRSGVIPKTPSRLDTAVGTIQLNSETPSTDKNKLDRSWDALDVCPQRNRFYGCGWRTPAPNTTN